MNLYRLLGVAKDATAEQVKKAYRSKAKKLHPDRGGDEEQFHRVHVAYEVLIDPDRRRRYDETGEYDESPTPEQFIKPEVKTLLFQCLSEAMFPQTMMGPPPDVSPKRTNLVNKMINLLDQGLRNKREEVKELKHRRKKLEEAVGRFTTDEEVNLLDGMVKHYIDSIDNTLKRLEVELAGIKETMEYVRKYKYRTDAYVGPKFEVKDGKRYKVLMIEGAWTPFNDPRDEEE